MPRKKVVVVLYPGEDCYVAYMPLFPGCTTQGETAEHALAMAKESLELALYEADEFDLWALDAYSDEVIVGAVELDFPVIPGPDWRFGEAARQYAEGLLKTETEDITA